VEIAEKKRMREKKGYELIEKKANRIETRLARIGIKKKERKAKSARVKKKERGGRGRRIIN